MHRWIISFCRVKCTSRWPLRRRLRRWRAESRACTSRDARSSCAKWTRRSTLIVSRSRRDHAHSGLCCTRSTGITRYARRTRDLSRHARIHITHNFFMFDSNVCLDRFCIAHHSSLSYRIPIVWWFERLLFLHPLRLRYSQFPMIDDCCVHLYEYTSKIKPQNLCKKIVAYYTMKFYSCSSNSFSISHLILVLLFIVSFVGFLLFLSCIHSRQIQGTDCRPNFYWIWWVVLQHLYF